LICGARSRRLVKAVAACLSSLDVGQPGSPAPFGSRLVPLSKCLDPGAVGAARSRRSWRRSSRWGAGRVAGTAGLSAS